MNARKAQLPSPRVRLMDVYCCSRLCILSLKTELPSLYSAYQDDTHIKVLQCPPRYTMAIPQGQEPTFLQTLHAISPVSLSIWAKEVQLLSRSCVFVNAAEDHLLQELQEARCRPRKEVYQQPQPCPSTSRYKFHKPLKEAVKAPEQLTNRMECP